MFKLRPSLLIALSFFLVILTGGILLSLPISSAKGTPTNFLDAYFTSNSATCVTGLVTLDTGVHFSLFGLIVILILIQVGGLGYMTFSIFMLLIFRQKLFISHKLALQEALNLYSISDVITVLRKIFLIVFSVEAAGALILFIRWLPEMGFNQALLYSIFHSVSAFNNAGFALPAGFANLSPYVTDITVNLVITSLIIIGGIGFIVITDIIQHHRFSLHSKVAITVTLCLLFFGTVLILGLEYNNPLTIGNMILPHKIMASYFQAVTPRTAGFNTLEMNRMIPASLILLISLMFIGASPGGTGGGIKTTTFALIASTIWATLKGYRDTVVFNRRIPPETIRRAFTITILAATLIGAAVFFLGNTEQFGVLEIFFETASAFGTVGLSMGITPYLSSIGKIIIIMVMFAGRVGPLTLLLALSVGQREPKIEPPKEGVSIG